MKYALNHPWKFEHAKLAFLVGLGQVMVILVIESVNFILLLANETHMEIVITFLALLFIS